MIFKLILSYACMLLVATESHAETVVTVPKDTKISIAMQSNINSVTSVTGDTFSAVVCEDLAVAGS